MVPESAGLALQQGHAGDGEGGVAALVALVAAGAGQCLLHVVTGDYPKSAGDAGRQLHVLDAARGLGADEVVVVGLAADDDAEAGDTADLRAAPLLGVVAADAVDDRAGGEGELERAGHRVVGDVADRDPGQLEAMVGAVQQPQRQFLVEAADDDRELQLRQLLLLAVLELLEECPRLSHPRPRDPCRSWRRGPRERRAPPRRGLSPRRAPGPGGAASGPSCRAWRAGRPRCERWGPTRSEPARRPRGRSPRGRRSFSGCW